MADLGKGPGGPAPHPLFLDQTEARRADKILGEIGLPHPLSKGLDDQPPPPLSQGLDPALPMRCDPS